MCTRPDDVSDLSALAEPSDGCQRTSVGWIYSSRVLHCRLLSPSAEFRVNSDCGVGQKPVCGAAAGAHDRRGFPGERRRRELVCER